MSDENLVLVENREGIAWITMNRPSALNALTIPMLDKVRNAIVAADKDPEVGVIVLTGTGRAWSTGVDLKSLGKLNVSGGDIGGEINVCARRFIEAVQTASKVVIAMVNGFVFTGALELLLSTDFIVASESAQFGDTHYKFGLRPTWGMTQRLSRIIGLNNAKYHSFTAKNISAQEAKNYGLVQVVVPDAQLSKEVEKICKAILKNSREALAAGKALYNRGWLTTLREGLENVEYSQSFVINDTMGRLASFINK